MTAVDPQMLRSRWLRSPVMAAVSTAALTLLAYMAWVGWEHATPTPDLLASPHIYEDWQVAGLGATLALLAGVVTWTNDGRIALVVIPLVLTIAYVGDGDDPWGLVLAPFVSVATFLVVLAAYVNVWIVKRDTAVRRPPISRDSTSPAERH